MILLKPLKDNNSNENCAYRAMITVLTRKKHRNTVYVLAENNILNKTLVSKIVLDKISNFDLKPKIGKLYLEELPKEFILYAKDNHNNSFTTLEGLKFNWQIDTLKSSSKKSINKKDNQVIEKIMANSLQTFKILLKGVNVGCARVSEIY